MSSSSLGSLSVNDNSLFPVSRSGSLDFSPLFLSADTNSELLNHRNRFLHSSSASSVTIQATNTDSLGVGGTLNVSNPSLSPWAQQLGTSGYEEATDIAVDSAGNVYLTGNTDGALGGTYAGNGDVWVAKYDSGGTQLWMQQLGSASYDYSVGVAVDTIGNVYLTGYTFGNLGGTYAGSGDAWVAKYDSEGSQVWTRQLGTSSYDYSFGVAVDNTGNVYLTGYTGSSLAGTHAGGSDAWVAKYDSSGTQLWTQQFGTSGYEYSNGVAVDSVGNVYLTGYTDGALGGISAGNGDVWVAKYDSSGTQSWTRQLGTSSYDYSNGIAVDSTGNVYLSGYTDGDLGGTYAGNGDAWVAKYDSSGTQSWTRQLGTSSYDYSNGVAVDGTGNVYVLGYTEGSLGGTYFGEIDAYVTKFNNSGTLLGTQQIGTATYDYASGIAVDSTGYVYIAGSTYGSLQGTLAGAADAWVFAKVNTSLLTTDNAGNTLTSARNITLDSTTSTFSDFVGTTDTNDYYRFTLYSRSTINLLLNALTADANLQLLDSNGVAIAKSSTSGTSAESISRTLEAGTYYIRVHPNGSASTNYNLDVSATPVLQWTRQLGTSEYDVAVGIAVDRAGNVYTTGMTNGTLAGANAGSSDAWLTKHDSGGNLLWTRQLGTSGYDSSEDVAVDSVGNVYITGYTEGNLGGANAGSSDAWVAKYDSNGNQLWIRQLGTSSSDSSYGVAVDSAGNVYITGGTSGNLGGANAGGGDAWVAKFNSTGTQLWTRQLGTSAYDRSYGVAVDSVGNVYITGDTSGNLGGTHAGSSDAWVAKFNSTGTQLWTRQLGTSAYDWSSRVAVDGAGNIYITGGTDGALGGTSAGNGDAWVAKYNSSGNQLWTRQFGTSEYDDAYGGIVVDSAGNVYVSGYTEGSLGGTYAGDGDAYVTKFNSSGTQLWTQQFGTSGYEYVYDISIDRFDNLYLAGETNGSLGGTLAGNYDAWIFAKFNRDIGGNTLATASNLGSLSGTRTYSNYIDAVGSEDYYQFNLSTESNFNLLLSGLIADAEVQLFDSNGVAIASSTNSGTEAESITTALLAGTYYLRIYGYNPFNVDVNTTYALNLTVS